VDIPPNFNVHEFKTRAEAIRFLESFGFKFILSRSDYEVWQTEEKPTVRANFYQDKNGVYIIARQKRKID
jgi:hypothetical protein